MVLKIKYFNNGRYYSPEIKRYLSPLSPEAMDVSSSIDLYVLTLTDPVNTVYNTYNIETSIPIVYDPPKLSNWDIWWGRYGGWLISGLQTVAGIGLCFVPGAQGLGVAMLSSGGIGLASNTMTSMGVDSKTSSIIASGANIIGGLGLLLTPFAPLGASMIGAGVGGISGGYISEALGGNYALGSMIGGIVGSIAGGRVYDHIVFSKIAQRGIAIGASGNYIDYAKAHNLAYYNGLPGDKVFRHILPHSMLSKLRWANNYRYIANVMKYSGTIYNLGSGGISYAREIALIGNYPFLRFI